ncbi:ABC transporter ATP-binding protein [Zhaonella formicivorans]|uniref:ABC transporter ATP-binding protein n=1 Tax=Zhaonella formicivorans TaxID=2528593 RepID=UPI0010CE27AB|nr:ABC transporter ATP-binding protein [Zhaonella formicivorans]
MYVEIKGLKFKYKNSSEEVIKNFNLQIAEGEIISILGESGSGKSTILRLVAGLEVPTGGMIKIGDKIMVDDSIFVEPEKRGVGMVFQDYALFPHLTVEGNVKFGLKKMNSREKAERLEEVLNLVNLSEYKTRYPYELSGGQQQRVALARALAPRPSLLLLDEPFSNLDKDLEAKIRDELKIILKTTGTTTIFVTHDRDDAQALADRAVILQRGEIVQNGCPEIC